MDMQPHLDICLSPALLHLYNTKDTVVVIIDIFRATSTITAALANGATAVIPVSSVKECVDAGMLNPGVLTAGERDGHIAPGLQYGNSPSAFPASFVKGKTVALTTTNGTRLMNMVQGAACIIAGSFMNLTAVCDFLAAKGKHVVLACSSWKDRVNLEDTLFAGAVAARIGHAFTVHSDSVFMATSLWKECCTYPSLFEYLKNATHFHRLSGYGLETDLRLCATVDLYNVVPVLKDGILIAEK